MGPDPSPLAKIYGPDVEEAAREACQRDYLAFGFRNWRPN